MRSDRSWVVAKYSTISSVFSLGDKEKYAFILRLFNDVAET